MKKGMKCILSFLMAFMICVGLFAICGANTVKAADDDIASGTSGTCSWVIDADGVLTISPTDGVIGTSGILDSYVSASPSWSAYAESVKKVKVSPGVSTSSGCCYLFANMVNCTEMDLRNLDTSRATTMSSMFHRCSSLQHLDLSNFDTSNVTNLSNMFYMCENLIDLDLSNFVTTNVRYMGSMFRYCSSLRSVDLSSFRVPKVTSLEELFDYCSSLVSVNLSTLNAGQLTNIRRMFRGCTSLESANVSGLDVSLVTDMGGVFDGCENLKTLDLSDWRTNRVTTLQHMFRGCKSLKSVDVSSFDVSHATRLDGVFEGCLSLEELDVSNWVTSSAQHLDQIFVHCESLESIDIQNFNTHRCTDLHSMFAYCNNLKKIVFGPNYYYKGNNIASHYYWGDIPNASSKYPYTGKWILEGEKEGALYASELLSLNDNDSIEGTWVWEKVPGYNINYVADGAAGSMKSSYAAYGEEFVLPSCEYYIFDHSFVYWDDGQGHQYENNGTIPAGIYEEGSTITLTAVFEKDNHNISMNEGAFEFSIKAGEKATFKDIPAGTTYQVYELTPDGWVLVQQENTSGVIEALEESAATFWNKYQPDVVTAQFTGTKLLDGHPAKEGTYTFELLDENRNVIQTKSVLDGGFVQFDPIEYTKNDVGEHTYFVREIDSQDDSIDYDSHEEVVHVRVSVADSKVCVHSSNIDDDGNKLHDYGSYELYTGVLSKPGAESLHLNMNYSNVRGSFYIWQGDYSAEIANLSANSNGSISGYTEALNPNTAYKAYSYNNDKDNMLITDELDVPGDTITVLYCSYAYPSTIPIYKEYSNYGFYISAGSNRLSSEVTYDEDGIKFDNKTRPGILRITKNADVTEANKDDKFTFEITFSNENGMPISDNIYWYVEDQN